MTQSIETIVVSGPPRSGTSLLMQMLVAAGIDAITDGVRVEDPDNPRGYFEHERVMRLAQDKTVLEDSAGKAIKIIHALLKHIPQEVPLAVLFLERDLDEVLASQFAMLHRLERPQPQLDPVRLRGVLAKQLTLVRAQLASRPNTRVLDVHYRQVIDDPNTVAYQIAGFLEPVVERSLDAQAMADCVDTGLYRKRLRKPD